MARAESASASAHSDSIRGLAQAVARPAYRRLLTAEPFLRRAVPVLIVAFLVTLGIAAFVDVRERLRQAVTRSAEELDLVDDASPRSASSALRHPKAAMRSHAASAPSNISTGRARASPAASSCSPTRAAPSSRCSRRSTAFIGRKLNEAIGRDPSTPAIAILPKRLRSHARGRHRASCSRCATSARRSASSRSRNGAPTCCPNGAPTPRSRSRCSPPPDSWC